MSAKSKHRTEKHQLVYAGFIPRGAAYVVDSLIVSTVMGVVYSVFKVNTENGDYSGLALLVYSAIATGLYAKTIGKRLFNLRVVPIKEEKISWKTAILREILGKFLSAIALAIGFLWVIWDKEKQSWHDKIAKTHVVLEKPLGKFQKVAAYILVFGIPLLFIIGIVLLIVLLATNPQFRDSFQFVQNLSE